MASYLRTSIVTILFFFLSIVTSQIFGQDVIGNLEAYLNEYLDEIPSSNEDDFVLPSDSELELWQSGLSMMDSGDLDAARDIFAQLNYQVLTFKDNAQAELEDYFLIEELIPSTNFWGTYVINQRPCRSAVVLQAPHTKHDTNTGKQAIYCFTRLSAKGLMLAGTHRCNSLEFSSCDGTTSTCSDDPDKYRNSDLAHNAQSIFQATTEWLSDENINNNFIQLHGFSKSADDPFLILSNGSRETPLVDNLSSLAEALINIDDSLTSKIPHIDLDWTRLVGFTNVQGRMLNEIDDPCDDPAILNSGRFLHIEQERTRLRADSEGWEKMRSALASVYDCEPVNVNQVDSGIQVELFPNPTSGNINIKGSGILSLQLWTIQGRLLFDEKYDLLHSLEVDLKKFSETIFLARIEIDGGVEWKKVVLVDN